MKLSILTLNIEGQKHLDLVSKFLTVTRPQVVCLQEVFKADLPFLAASIGDKTAWQFVPMLIVDRENSFGLAARGEYGMAFMSSRPIRNLNWEYYFGTKSALPLINDRESNTSNRAVLWVEVQSPSGVWLKIATTHFTWSPNGKNCRAQEIGLEKLHQIYRTKIKTGLFCGDFNAPRGGEIYQRLSENFIDHIPQTVKTTLDSTLHRHQNLQYVVDYLFTTPEYQMKNVQLKSGLSDHLGILGQLSLKSTLNS
ncbi:MAG TPA: hypothetical protein DEP87_03160 [Candidatus Pacebacteria bacterium]|nr:hypothetical protein [Candidatus Paceibacterota bacterium]